MNHVSGQHRWSALWLAFSLSLLAVGGCQAGQDARVEEPAEPAAPAALEAPTAGQVFRFIDPATGKVGTSATFEAIPESARTQVLVFDASAPTPAGWEHVADLSGELPAKTAPTRGFVLRPTGVVDQPASTTKASKAPHRVVMFSTQGCGYCKKARAFFDKHGVAHSEYDVERDPKAAPKLQELAKEAGVPVAQLQGGVPLIFINGAPHVGFDQAKISRLLGI